MTDDDIRDALIAYLAPRGAATEMAERLGVTKAYISQMKTGLRPVSDRVAQVIGFRKRVIWERK